MTKIIATVTTPPYWCTKSVNKPKAPFECRMVLCMIVGRANRRGRDKGVYFARVPSVVTNQGKEAENLSRERRSRWISEISTDDLTEDILENDRVCGRHFVSGNAAKSWDRCNVDWVPTLCLGHSKKVGPQNLEKVTERSQRERDCEKIKNPAQEQREKELEAERTSKRIQLSKPGHQIADINFSFDE